MFFLGFVPGLLCSIKLLKSLKTENCFQKATFLSSPGTEAEYTISQASELPMSRTLAAAARHTETPNSYVTMYTNIHTLR